MFGHGKALKVYLKSEGIVIDEFAKKIGVTRGTIYDWYKQAELAEEIIVKLEKRGKVPREIFKIAPDTEEEVSMKDQLIDSLKRENDLLRTLLEQKGVEIHKSKAS